MTYRHTEPRFNKKRPKASRKVNGCLDDVTAVAGAVNQQVLVEDEAGELSRLNDARDDDGAPLELLGGIGINGNLLKGPSPVIGGPALEDLVDGVGGIGVLGHPLHHLSLLRWIQGGLGELERENVGEDLRKSQRIF